MSATYKSPVLRNRLINGLLLVFCLSFMSVPVHAAKGEVYTGYFSNTGAGGYDVVAYFAESRPVKGDDEFQVEYKGADWYFSSRENLALFEADPDKYVPQYGGYCAWAVAQGYTASGDPLQWAIVGDRLYLNYNASIQARWSKNKDQFILQGDTNWPNVLN